MKASKFHSLVLLFLFAGYFIHLRDIYPLQVAAAVASTVAVLIYGVPVALIQFAKNSGHSIITGVLLGTLWEFIMAAFARAMAFPAWESFLLAGVGGALTTAFLAFVRQEKEKQNENAVEAKYETECHKYPPQ
ncbi:hypothetical protein [Thermococcus sp.]|uniref:hypothetical protein n=1 Tax=Thermococcus sp. TaxID=35749 RepID=UPI0025FC21AC|nr:hypothetical protein [Thermococcus sp.]